MYNKVDSSMNFCEREKETLKENGLKVLEEVCPLSARMVVNQVSMKMENERIRKLIEDLRRVLQEEM